MALPDIEELTVKLTVSVHSNRKEREKRRNLISAIEEYFGEHDARIVLAVAVYFREPYRNFHLYKELMEVLSDEDPVGNQG